MRIEKRFLIPIWNESLKQKSINFWSKRGVVFEKIEENALHGKRGSLLGNLFSYDMSKLISTLSISVLPDNELTCILDVNTVMQGITDRNKEYWNLEMNTFESFLLRNDEQVDNWEDFRKRSVVGAIIWTLTFGLFGDGLSNKREKK
jgi:hypothetical protein